MAVEVELLPLSEEVQWQFPNLTKVVEPSNTLWLDWLWLPPPSNVVARGGSPGIGTQERESRGWGHHSMQDQLARENQLQ